MSKRVSSRDDLFLSAVDMYTLLSMVFIGVAFMAASGAGGQDVLNLPVVQPSGRTSKASKTPLTMSWARPQDSKGTEGQFCQIRATPGSAKPEEKLVPLYLSVECWPHAFGSTVTVNPPDSQWIELREKDSTAVVQCARDNDDLVSCARLQWVVAEHGFKTVAAVRTPAASEGSEGK